MEYNKIDILTSKTNITNYKKEVNESKNYMNNVFLQEINNNNWKCKSKNTFIQKIGDLTQELTDFEMTMNEAISTIDTIAKIQEFLNQNATLLNENKLLEISNNPIDKAKLINNNEMINSNKQIIEQLENQIITKWGDNNE